MCLLGTEELGKVMIKGLEMLEFAELKETKDTNGNYVPSRLALRKRKAEPIELN